jgi:hypothetical protein
MATPVASYGTLQIADLLRANNTSIIDFGLMDVYAAVRAYQAAYNALVAEQLGTFVQRTTERITGSAGPATLQAIPTDEVGVPDTQKVSGPTQMGWPLRKWDVALQWTRHWLMNHTPREMALQAQAAQIADRQKLQENLRRAIFTPTNRTTVDRLRDNMSIPVKAFANADGFPIPPSPNGFTFDPATHTHYMGTTGTSGTTLVAADVDSLLANVLEHFNGGQIALYVSQDVEATMNAGRYASSPTFPAYAPLVYNQQIAPTNNGFFTEGSLLQSAPFNRFVGTYRDAQVFVKPWMPAGTLFAYMMGTKPIAMRIPDRLAGAGTADRDFAMGGGAGDFQMLYESDDYPLQCQVWSREYGFGVQDRVAGAVMAVGATSYAMPTVTSGATGYVV